MNKNIAEGKWEQFKGEAKQKWGKLTSDDWDVVEGKRDVLAGKIQEKYGYAQERAHKEIDEFFDRD